ncbi:MULTISPECIES: hypothetical protein [Methylobacteriaceae]|uniref:hypothetical protein n=1 Tax=Methylobacteriaceae TaxID=119045 RepID=UPI002F3573FF
MRPGTRGKTGSPCVQDGSDARRVTAQDAEKSQLSQSFRKIFCWPDRNEKSFCERFMTYCNACDHRARRKDRKMHSARALTAALLLGAAGLPASATPLPVQPAPLADSTVEAIDWHPSTRHWDHHFHAHQESLRHHRPTEAERRLHQIMRGSDSPTRDQRSLGSRYRLGDRLGGVHRY